MIEYSNLPNELKDLIASAEIEDKVLEIGNKYNLHVDIIGELSSMIDEVLMGIITRREFSDQIQDRLDVSSNVANQILNAINQEIFLPIRSSLRQIETESSTSSNTQIDDEINTKDIMNTISNPTSIPTPSRTYEKEIPEAVIVEKKLEVEVPSAPLPNTESSPYEMKLSQTTQSSGQTKDINLKDRSNLIPSDHKERINNDPYKESVE